MLPPAWRLREFDSLPSTSDHCTESALRHEPAGLAVLARQQTAARGSRGRAWQTLPGNLALSVLLRPEGLPGLAGHYALLAAVVLAEALEACGAPRVRVKWPNDILLDGGKLGGVLIDSSVAGGALQWLVIGFGANLAAAPDLPGAACLPRPASSRAVAGALLDRMSHWLALCGPEDFAPVHQAWLERGPPLDAPLRVSGPGGTIHGAFAGLSSAGALLLRSGGGIRAFATGEVLQGS